MDLVSGLKMKMKHRINLIRSSLANVDDQIVLVRSLLEDWAVINFILAGPVRPRVELFRCYTAFEWRSHAIFGLPYASAEKQYFQLLVNLARTYPFGFRKYYRLVKNRVIKQVNKDRNLNHAKSYLALLTSVKSQDRIKQFHLVASYMANHLITKLPFPYRVVFGKSITFLVLRYTPVKRGDYWLLADLSHGIVFDNQLDLKSLRNLVDRIIHQVEIDLRLRP